MFHVCRNFNSPSWFILSGGTMSPIPHIGPYRGSIQTDISPTELAIWIDQIDGAIFKWQISVDVGDTNTPPGNYSFWDGTGERYELWAWGPYTHTLKFNSDSPSVSRIMISLRWLASAPGDWGNAPSCQG